MDFYENQLNGSNGGVYEGVVDNRGFGTPLAIASEDSVLTRVFKWMALGLGISAVSAFATFLLIIKTALINIITPVILLLCIAEIILVLYFSTQLTNMSADKAKKCFIAYSIMDGITLSIIFLAYSGSLIFSTFLIAGVMFALAALYGKTTNANLSSMGSILLIGLIGIIIGGIVNIFIMNSMLDFIITVIGIVLFLALTAYDVNKIKLFADQIGVDTNENVDKVVIYGAFQLYLDFINIFIKLLRLRGRNRN